MKRKTVIICTALSCVLGCFLVVAFFVVRDTRAMARRIGIMNGIKSLQPLVERFRNDHGLYPPSLQHLEADATPEERKVLTEILHQHFRDRYEYRPLSNGFTITVRGERCAYESLTNGFNIVVGRETNQVRSW